MKTMWKYGIMLGVALALATSLGWGASKNLTANVTLSVATTMPDGAVLQPGTYKMTLLSDQQEPKVEFYKNGKLICKCPVKLEALELKPDYTRLEYTSDANEAHFLNSVAVDGWTQKVIFGNPPENAGS